MGKSPCRIKHKMVGVKRRVRTATPSVVSSVSFAGISLSRHTGLNQLNLTDIRGNGC